MRLYVCVTEGKRAVWTLPANGLTELYDCILLFIQVVTLPTVRVAPPYCDVPVMVGLKGFVFSQTGFDIQQSKKHSAG